MLFKNALITIKASQFFTQLIFFALIAFSIQAASDVCWKNTFGRGVGTVPGTCGPDEEKSGLLCYKKCPLNERNTAGICSQVCPDGFIDDGLLCRKPDAYGRGAGYALWDQAKCNSENPQGCEEDGAIWYPKCKEGFTPAGCCICSPICPTDMMNMGISCAKVGSKVESPITPRCSPGMENSTGLCYKTCSANYIPVGPVCWGKCPPDKPVDCGAMCGRTSDACANAITEQIFSVADVAIKVAELIATMGASEEIEAATASATAALKTIAEETGKEVAKEMAKQLAKTATKAVIKQAIAAKIKNKAPNLAPKTREKLADMVTEPEKFDYKSFLIELDPTGLASVVDSFDREICR